jgi:hypothetical protein
MTMNWREDMAGEKPEMEQALRHFKASMDAWSEAALSRPRTMAKTSVRRTWRLAASGALACLLAAGSLTAVVHHRQEMAKLTAQKAAQQAAEVRAAAEREAASHARALEQNRAQAAATVKQEAGTQDEDLLASVDQDVSQQVPAAMEPLAQLMDDNGTE